MKHLLLIVLPTLSKQYDSTQRYKTTVIPYGVLSIATYIKYNCKNTKVYILDLCIKNNEKYLQYPYLIKDFLQKKEIDIVGISCMFSGSLTYLGDYAKIIKEANSSIFTFVGGITASNQYEMILNRFPEINAVSFGEGELPIAEFLNSDSPEQFLHNHVSWITKEDISIKHPQSTYITNLDDIPFLDYDMIGPENYEGRMWAETPVVSFPMHATRGCPFNCIFCCAGNNHGKKIRKYTPERFIEDATKIVTIYNGRKISIDDDQFLLNQNYAKQILRGLSKLSEEYGVEFEFPSGLSVRFIDDEVAELMSKCKVKEIPLAIESGSPRMLKYVIDKPLAIEEIAPAVERLHRNGVLAKAFWVIGIPGETPEDRKMSLELMKKAGFDWNNIAIAMPIPGSRLYKICIDNNYIDKIDTIELLPDDAAITAPYIDPPKISEEVYLMNLDANFVNNNALRTQNWDLAEEQFHHITSRYPFHAIAHYCYAKALKMNNRDQALVNKHYDIFKKIISEDLKWRSYAEYFALDTNDKLTKQTKT